MTEKTQDELMAAFIERATPKLLDALADKVKEQVEGQVSGLVESSTRMLDEIKDMKREREEAAAKQAEDFGQIKTLIERGDSPAAIKDALNPEPIKLTREQARDRTIYQRAKAQAEANGTTLRIVANPEQ